MRLAVTITIYRQVSMEDYAPYSYSRVFESNETVLDIEKWMLSIDGKASFANAKISLS